MIDADTARAEARAMWGAGHYDTIAEHIWSVGGQLIRRLALAPGAVTLDVACGTGNAAIQAAQGGASVTGIDVTPSLLDVARQRARAAGVPVDFREADAEALPFADASFDVVLSTFGAMFAPRHLVTAKELVRVLRPSGLLGMCNWTAEGEIGTFFAILARHTPTPPVGDPPLAWGDEARVRELFAQADVDLSFEHETVLFQWGSVDEAVDTYADAFGPVVVLRRALEPTGRWPALRGELVEWFTGANTATDGTLTFRGDYLTVVGRRGQ